MLKYFLLFLFFISGCAKPNYQDTSSPNTPISTYDYQLTSTSKNLNIGLNFEKPPTTNGEVVFTIKFYHPQTPEILIDADSAWDVILWMPSMGHGSSPVKIEKIATGYYRVSRVYFIMPGDWDLIIRFKNSETLNVTEQIIQKFSL